MTIINSIEIDKIEYSINHTTEAILNNEPIDDTLHVVTVISNPCQYATRYILAKQFIRRMERTPNISLYVVELAYGEQPFRVTTHDNKRHLQIRTTEPPLWQKENMINIGIRRLLPQTWRAVAWIDADIEFDNPYWALDALKILNGYKDIIQVFSHAVDMDKMQYTMQLFSAFGYQYERGRQYKPGGLDFWHPGYAWACTRKAYEKMGGLYERSVLGSGDHNMALSLIGYSNKSLNGAVHPEYKEHVLEFQHRVKGLRLGYSPGIIRHYFHGHKADRKYHERWHILTEHQYNPRTHVTLNEIGLMVPTPDCPKALLTDILEYFKQRNEDN